MINLTVAVAWLIRELMREMADAHHLMLVEIRALEELELALKKYTKLSARASGFFGPDAAMTSIERRQVIAWRYA